MSDATRTPVDDTFPRSKPEILDRIDQAWTALQRLIGEATEHELVSPGGEDGWNVKDHIAHIASWERSLTALLHGKPRYEAMGIDRATFESDAADRLDRINQVLHQHNRDRSLNDVLAGSRQAHQEVLKALSGMSYDDLLLPYAHYQPDQPEQTDPVGYRVLRMTADHLHDHLKSIGALLATIEGQTETATDH